jgi:prolyl-tRNA editing enzyme YbaK/EbsC (Cys-tRNA(Pro) deacylase)
MSKEGARLEVSPSVERVRAAAEAAGLSIDIVVLPAAVKTARLAADAVGCGVAQIANSLIFAGARSGRLVLLLASGGHRVDLEKAAAAVGEPLERADPGRVRAETGFAIGGVAPLGHLAPLPVWMDRGLLDHPVVWAAGGRAETVFSVDPADLARATGATVADLS